MHGQVSPSTAIEPTSVQSTICQWIDHGGATHYSDRFWTLDPIDGTKGFLRGEQYAVALALIVAWRSRGRGAGVPSVGFPAQSGTSRRPTRQRKFARCDLHCRESRGRFRDNP